MGAGVAEPGGGGLGAMSPPPQNLSGGARGFRIICFTLFSGTKSNEYEAKKLKVLSRCIYKYYPVITDVLYLHNINLIFIKCSSLRFYKRGLICVNTHCQIASVPSL